MAPHSSQLCSGSCPDHPLLTTSFLRAERLYTQWGIGWGDTVYDEMVQEEKNESADAKQKRLNAAAAADLQASLGIQSFDMKNYAEEVAITVRKGLKRHEESKKICKPCKWLYCNEAAPKALWFKGADGKLCAPKVSYVTGAQCWAHEYVDPKTQVKKAPHKCPYLHPGEEGWCSEWQKNSLFSPMKSAVQNRFVALKC